MHFTRLRLNGFKSFVDPTDLVIADGLTGVVGPNGCGKSNLLEALRWVMGENRPTAMRGGGMEDVIFAGAATRPARNFAEVSLSVDNSERRAPPGFNEADVLEIARRITRDAGSAYKCNGREMRARDVQMLFADASTGSHSPALVRQGQIAELINAKPKSRRRVLEEAAGISGLYQRRHEADLKLRATEANLERVQDTVDQLASQLGTLARQARQAARYRAIGTDLRRAEWLLLYLRWRSAQDALEAARAGLRAATTEAARAEAEARKADTARADADAALPPLREEDSIAAAILQRIVGERDSLAAEEAAARDRIATLEERAAQIARDRDREGGLTGDAEKTLARLAEETARLEAAQAGQDARRAEAETAAQDAADALTAREADQAALTERVAALAARHDTVDRRLAEGERTRDRAQAQARKAEAEAQAARETAQAGRGRVAEAAAAREAAQTALAEAEARAQEAQAARTTAEAAEAETRAALGAAEGTCTALRAEADTVRKLLAREGDATGGVLASVSVADGFEQALGAALGEGLEAPVWTDGAPQGWRALPPLDPAPDLPEGVTLLSEKVAGPAELSRALSQVGVVDADVAEALSARLAPGQALVTVAGALWRWDGYRAEAATAGASAARHLEQRNRLATLERSLTEADATLADLRQKQEAAAGALADAMAAEKAARAEVRRADGALSEATRAESRAETESARAESQAETQDAAALRHREAAQAAQAECDAAAREKAALDGLSDARTALADLKTAVEGARITLMTRRAALDEEKRAGEGRARRLAAIARERQTWEDRQATAGARLADLDRRAEATQTDLAAARGVPATLEAKRADLAGAIATAEARKAAAADAVAAAEAGLRAAASADREAAEAAGAAREARARAEARVEAADAGARAAADRITEETGHAPDALLQVIETDPADMPGAEALEVEITRLRRARDALGAVNLRAEEDAAEVQAEHDTLVSEREDLAAATARLREGIAALNREGRERLLTAFEQVNESFGTLFTHLFGGGEARLSLVESDDPLEAGLEILCQPPGKNLSTLSLLSGGEQTLTALALIFAVFLANPAPICVLDEVDAPLDDANVGRFCDLLDEMTRRTQTRFLIITHHAVTMGRMDRLFGVTMAEQGVSQLVSVDLKNAESLVA